MDDYDRFVDRRSGDFDTDPWDTDNWDDSPRTGCSTDEGRWTENALRIPLPDEAPPLCLNIRKEDIWYVGALAGLVCATAMLGIGLVLLLQLRVCQAPIEQASSSSEVATHARSLAQHLGDCFKPATAGSVLTFLMIVVGLVVDVLGIIPFIIYTCVYRRNYLFKLRMRALHDTFSPDAERKKQAHEQLDDDTDANGDTRWQTPAKNYIAMSTLGKTEKAPFISSDRDPDFDM